MNSFQKILQEIEFFKKKKNKEIRMIAVSKGQTIKKIAELYSQGQREFGENYVQELIQKAEEAKRLGLADIKWVMIGHLQRNKVKQVLPIVKEVQSIDSLRLWNEVEKVGTQGIHELPSFMIQVKTAKDNEQKSGCSVEEAQALAEKMIDFGALFSGFMAIPEPGKTKEAFQTLERLKKQFPDREIKISLGMSQDYREALEHGSDCVRLGTVLFGSRKN